MKKWFEVQAPIHQIFAFRVYAETAEEAMLAFDQDVFAHDWWPTHDWRESPDNVLAPIRVEPGGAQDESETIEIQTDYLNFLASGRK